MKYGMPGRHKCLYQGFFEQKGNILRTEQRKEAGGEREGGKR